MIACLHTLAIQSKSETFENKVKVLDDKITKNHQVNEDKFKILKDQITKIQEGLATEIIAREVSSNFFQQYK